MEGLDDVMEFQRDFPESVETHEKFGSLELTYILVAPLKHCLLLPGPFAIRGRGVKERPGAHLQAKDLCPNSCFTTRQPH